MFKDICINSKSCELMKSVNKPKYGSRAILTDSCWEYVALFLKRQSMAGASDALFYWEQAHSFYLAVTSFQPALASVKVLTAAVIVLGA